VLTIVIPTLNAEAGLPSCLDALMPAVVSGLLRQVVIVDGGSQDHTLDIAEHAGADVVQVSPPGRGRQLAAGADAARHPWLLFLHADTVLAEGWDREAAAFMERVDRGQRPPAAASFRFTLDDLGLAPRIIEWGVRVRCTLLRFPYGDQGLLIPRALYRQIGGYRDLSLMEDVDIVRRLERGQRISLRSEAVTSAIRYKRDGYALRTLRNLACISLYRLRAPLPVIERVYRAGGT
jgi:rSAM/selenodomain-associated transferase 2